MYLVGQVDSARFNVTSTEQSALSHVRESAAAIIRGTENLTSSFPTDADTYERPEATHMTPSQDTRQPFLLVYRIRLQVRMIGCSYMSHSSWYSVMDSFLYDSKGLWLVRPYCWDKYVFY